MAKILTDTQKERFKRLETALTEACAIGELDSAKAFAKDIRALAKSTDQNSRWLLNLNKLCEASINYGDYNFAIQHLHSVIATSNQQTRLRIEAHALLAVAYIRTKNLDYSKEHISKAIENIKNIRSRNRRKFFYEKLVMRMEEEAILFGSVLNDHPVLDIDEIQNKAIELVKTKAETELLAIIGTNLPSLSIQFFNEVRNSTLLQIPHVERLQLPPPNATISFAAIGKKAVGALKLVCWRALCDENDDLYKGWVQNVDIFYSKKVLSAAVGSILIEYKIGSTLFAAALVAYLFRIGCKVFCKTFAPVGIMVRHKK